MPLEDFLREALIVQKTKGRQLEAAFLWFLD